MNLGQLKQQLQDLGYGSDTAAQQLDFINATYREIHSRERWPFLEAIDQTQSTVAGTPAYTPPMANWRNIDAIRLDQPAAQNYFSMDYMDPQSFFDAQHLDQNFTGMPEVWTMYASQVWFYPIPDAAYRVSYYYIAEPADLASDSDVPLIPVAFHDVLVAGALVRSAQRQRDYLTEEIWQSKYADSIRHLEEEYKLRQRQTSSEVKRSGAWDSYSDYRRY